MARLCVQQVSLCKYRVDVGTDMSISVLISDKSVWFSLRPTTSTVGYSSAIVQFIGGLDGTVQTIRDCLGYAYNMDGVR